MCIYVVNLRILVANVGFRVEKASLRLKIGGQLRAISPTDRPDSPPARTGAPVRPGDVRIYVVNLRILVPNVAFRAGKVGPVLTNVLFPGVKLRPLVGNIVFRVPNLQCSYPMCSFYVGTTHTVWTNVHLYAVKLRTLCPDVEIYVGKLHPVLPK